MTKFLLRLGYQLLRHQDPSEYQMCYTLRRGFSDLSKLGPNRKSYQVGRLFSGLAIAPRRDKNVSYPLSSPDSNQPGSVTLNELIPVHLCTTVYYRTQMDHQCSSNKSVPVVEEQNKANCFYKNRFGRTYEVH